MMGKPCLDQDSIKITTVNPELPIDLQIAIPIEYVYDFFQVFVSGFTPDCCIGGAVGVIVGAAIAIAKSLAGTTLGVFTAVSIIIGVGIGAYGSDGTVVGIAVLVGAVATDLVGVASNAVVFITTLVVISIAILVFNKKRGIPVSLGAVVGGLVIVSGLHVDFVSGTSLATSLGVSIGLFTSTIQCR